MAIWCARLAIDRWQLAEGPRDNLLVGPVALISESAHGLRITAVNAAARDAGVRSGTMLTDARALCPELAAAPADPAGDLALLEGLALWAQRWGPWSALDPPDGLLVDVTGVAHLFGGEQMLLVDASERLAARGFAARLAIAPTAGAAWALAHYGPERAILPRASPSGGGGSHEVADGGGMARQQTGPHRPACGGPPPPKGETLGEMPVLLDQLPVAALRLDPATLLVLRRLGLKRIGELSGVARDALARRFRSVRAPAANPLVRLDQLTGRVPEPLLPVLAAPPPLVQRRLIEPIRHRPLLDQVLGDLADDMVRVLEGQALGARRLELALWKVDGEVVQRRLELAAATRAAAHITRLFAAKLDDVDAGFGIELARLTA
ncbi:MAG: DNA polymerase Y family protein, partial [Pseudomonadota bacterium]|nr:DNA polymerase Y family protein [Pseudomonadota bacterium]